MTKMDIGISTYRTDQHNINIYLLTNQIGISFPTAVYVRRGCLLSPVLSPILYYSLF